MLSLKEEVEQLKKEKNMSWELSIYARHSHFPPLHPIS